MKKILALVMVVAMMAALAVTTSAAEVPEEGLIAHFTFDDLDAGLKGAGAVATPVTIVADAEPEIVVTTDDAHEGGAVDLGASGQNFLNVTKEDGTPLLSGLEGFTVSYWSKNNAGTGWNFFAVPGDIADLGAMGAQTYLSERYIGILEGASDVAVERYNCTGARTYTTGAVTHDYADAWKLITVSVGPDSVELYINGEWWGGMESGLLDMYPNHELASILGDDSKLFIGFANWESGEYSTSLVDDYVIYDHAMTEAEVVDLATAMGVEGLSAPAETEAPSTEPTTEAPETEPTTEAPAGDGTEAPEGGSPAPAGTQAAPAETNASDDEGGCGSTLGAAAAIVALAGVFGCAIVKKH